MKVFTVCNLSLYFSIFGVLPNKYTVFMYQRNLTCNGEKRDLGSYNTDFIKKTGDYCSISDLAQPPTSGADLY